MASSWQLYLQQQDLAKQAETRNYQYDMRQYARQRQDMNTGLQNSAISSGNARASFNRYNSKRQNSILSDEIMQRRQTYYDFLKQQALQITANRPRGGGGRRQAPADPPAPHITSDQYAAVAAQMYNGGPSPGIYYQSPAPAYSPPNPSNYTQYDPYRPATGSSSGGGGGSGATGRPRYTPY